MMKVRLKMGFGEIVEDRIRKDINEIMSKYDLNYINEIIERVTRDSTNPFKQLINEVRRYLGIEKFRWD